MTLIVSSTPTTLAKDARGWTSGVSYSAANVGPASSTTFAFWLVFKTLELSSNNGTMVARGDGTAPTAANGFYEIYQNGNALAARVSDGSTIIESPSAGIGTSTQALNQCWAVVATVSGGKLHFFVNGYEVSSGTTITAVAAQAAGNKLTIGMRYPSASVSLNGVLGFGGSSAAVPTTRQIQEWTEDCVTQRGMALMPGATHHWDARDLDDTPQASWTCRISGQVLSRNGAPRTRTYLPVWGGNA